MTSRAPRSPATPVAAMRPDVAFLVFAAAFFAFHHAWVIPQTMAVAVAVGVLDAFAIVAATALVLSAFGAPRVAMLLAVAGATLYVHARGAHLAANSIQGEIDAPIVTFWDERFGHIAGVIGWVALTAAFCLAERGARRPPAPSMVVLAPAGLLLGWTAFTSTVEGQTWWLELVAAALFALWARWAPRPLLWTVAAAFALGALLILGWAAWHGGVPEFTAV